VIATLLAAAIAVATSTPLVPGKLCIDAAPCIATEGVSARITPAETSRRFVWTADDQSVVAVGVIDSNATDVVLNGGTSRVLQFRGAALPSVAFELSSPTALWRWTMVKPPPSLRLLHPACDGCVLSAGAKGFRRFEKPLAETKEVVLHALPHIRGRVIDRKTGAPLDGATITIANVLIGRTAADGGFDVTIEKEWPRAIDIEYPGRAPRRMEVPVAVANADLSSIALSTGGSLRVTFEPPLAQNLTWELRDPKSHDLRRQGTIGASATYASVDGIGEGKYHFVIRGAKPLQQYSVTLNIEAESVTDASIAIEPATLRLEVEHGSRPFAGAKTVVAGPEQSWDGELRLDEDGHASEEIWQRGKFSATFFKESRGIYAALTTITAEQTTWRITVPDHRVIGRVIDASTGAAVREAILTLWINTPTVAGARATKSDDEGRFEFDGIDAGTVELKADRDGYVRVEGIMVDVGEADGTYKQDVPLRPRTSGRPLAVTDESGAPIADALVILASVDGVREIAYTQIDGTAAVPLANDDHGVVFVIPRSGSFAFTRLGPRNNEDPPISIRVPAASAAIDVQTHTEGEPLAGVLLVPRVDGMMLPGQILDALQNMQGVSFFTDANGRAHLAGLPRGLYELWGVTGRDEMRAVRSPVPPPPAASLDVVSGRYDVRIGFAPTTAP
jgi:hypothetical protein